MNHRIGAGVIVERDGRILLVRHRKAGVYDFWVAPGGGVDDEEDLLAAARREVFEESGLNVKPLQIAYIEEFTKPNLRECKVWFIGRFVGGVLNSTRVEAARENIVEAAWVSRAEFAGKTVYPPMLNEDYWRDKEGGFAFPRYVGIRELDGY
ncbi:MAG: NUDIX hydrolase [Betaproteobacteria bacterium]